MEHTEHKILQAKMMMRSYYILFKKAARVPSVMGSPMKGTTASTRSPSK